MVTKKTVGALLLCAVSAGLSGWIRTRRSGTAKRSGKQEQGDSGTVVEASQTAKATERYLLYFTVPLWVVAGSLDYFWHRRTKIETTSGTTESTIHALMMTEAGIPMLLGLLLEINSGVILLMMVAFLAHAATAI